MGSARALHCLSPQPPRPCEVYRAEWELCRSAGHVLHHYYVHGERPDCRQWLRDLTSCRKWEESRSAEAQNRAEEDGDVGAMQQY
ncbi:synaptic plasticity regulator PANTS isoform X3 [Arvicanthis niloticus]|uniref:synaptic plasticity regulator PANTS isoform X3 n=1 Tax=Arvicanthis niloticus TaxID=61156 RepID=UPI00402BCABD